MSVSDGELLYGYPAGGGEVSWLFDQLNDDGEIEVSWYDDRGDFNDAADIRLDQAGIDTSYKNGINFVTIIGLDYPEYFFGFNPVTACEGGPEPLDFKSLAEKETWMNSELARALEVLEISFGDTKPGWYLSACE